MYLRANVLASQGCYKDKIGGSVWGEREADEQCGLGGFDGGVVKAAFQKHVSEGKYAFARGWGCEVCDEYEGYDEGNFAPVSADWELRPPATYAEKVEEEARYEREYKGRADAAPSAARAEAAPSAARADTTYSIGDRLVEEAEAIEAAEAAEAAGGKGAAKVGDAVAVISFRNSKLPKFKRQYFRAVVRELLGEDSFLVQFEGRDYVSTTYHVLQSKQGSWWRFGHDKAGLILPDRKRDAPEAEAAAAVEPKAGKKRGADAELAEAALQPFKAAKPLAPAEEAAALDAAVAEAAAAVVEAAASLTEAAAEAEAAVAEAMAEAEAAVADAAAEPMEAAVTEAEAEAAAEPMEEGAAAEPMEAEPIEAEPTEAEPMEAEPMEAAAAPSKPQIVVVVDDDDDEDESPSSSKASGGPRKPKSKSKSKSKTAAGPRKAIPQKQQIVVVVDDDDDDEGCAGAGGAGLRIAVGSQVTIIDRFNEHNERITDFYTPAVVSSVDAGFFRVKHLDDFGGKLKVMHEDFRASSCGDTWLHGWNFQDMAPGHAEEFKAFAAKEPGVGSC